MRGTETRMMCILAVLWMLIAVPAVALEAGRADRMHAAFDGWLEEHGALGALVAQRAGLNHDATQSIMRRGLDDAQPLAARVLDRVGPPKRAPGAFHFQKRELCTAGTGDRGRIR